MAIKHAVERVRDYAVMRRDTGDGQWVVAAWHEDAPAALSAARKCVADGSGDSIILMRVSAVVLSGGAQKV